MKTITLLLCRFTIKLVFHTSEYPEYEKELYNYITYLYKPLIIKNTSKTPDYTIHIEDADWIGMQTIKKGKSNFFKLYTTSGKHEITTSYHTNPVLFQLILKHILDGFTGSNSILIHASSLVINGKANVFCGVSGAGKSTVVSLLKDKYRAIAEDSLYVAKQGNKFIAYQTPFMEKFRWIERGSNSFEFGKIFFLIQSDSCRAEKITSKEVAFEEFMKRFAVFKKTYKNQIKFTLELISVSDCYYLYFTKNAKDLRTVIGALS